MKPIIFNTEMVRAILDRRKTQTRRVIKPQPRSQGMKEFGEAWEWRKNKTDWFAGATLEQMIASYGLKQYCPYGLFGGKLWVRETFFHDGTDCPGNLHYRANATKADEAWFVEEGWKWKPSIHMPKEYSRITLEIKDVRVERVQDISEEDAKAEGVFEAEQCDHIRQSCEDIGCYGNGYKATFASLWDSINLKRGYGWDTNPFCWVLDFSVVGK